MANYVNSPKLNAHEYYPLYSIAGLFQPNCSLCAIIHDIALVHLELEFSRDTISISVINKLNNMNLNSWELGLALEIKLCDNMMPMFKFEK